MKLSKYTVEPLFFILLFIIISVFILSFSPLVNLIYGHDVPLILDGAWRIQCGQIADVDFSTIMGYGYLFQQYIFLKAFHYNMYALTISSLVTTTVMMTAYLFLYRSSTFANNSTRILRIYSFLLIVALGLGQYNFGTHYKSLTYANLYNRYCFEALLVTFLLLSVLNNRRIGRKVILILIAVALLLNYILFIKITYFGVAILFILILLWQQHLSAKIFTYLFVISIVVFGGVLLFSHENFFAILNDYRNVSSVRTGLFLTPSFLKLKLKHPFNIALILCYLLILFQSIKNKVGLKKLSLLLYIGIMGILVHFTNWGETDIVLYTFIPCLLFLPQFNNCRNYWSFKLFMLVVVFFLYKNFYSIAELSFDQKYKHTELKNPYISGFYIDWVKPECDYEYSARATAGVQLINKNIRSGEKIMPFTFDNPFSLLTHTIPPKHIPIAWQFETTYSNTVYPKPNKLFSDVNLVLIPNCDEPEASKHMRVIYAEELQNHFTKIDMDRYWTLYRKTK